MSQAHKNLQKINDFVLDLEILSHANIPTTQEFDTTHWREKFEAAMDDDLNTTLALSQTYEMITQCNIRQTNGTLSSEDAKNILALWKKMNSVFGFVLQGQAEIPEEIKELMQKREDARTGKDFKKSDELRDLIAKHGFVVEDTKDGQKIKPVN
jgi:cysteinyl-tRNA synthetase